MTYLEKAKKLYPWLPEKCIVGIFCPADLIPNCDICPRDKFIDHNILCEECWKKEVKE